MQFTMPKDLPARPPHSVFQWYKHFAGYAPASDNTNDPIKTVLYGNGHGKELHLLTPVLTLLFPPNSHKGRRLCCKQFCERYASDKADFEQHLAAREQILAGLSKLTLEQQLATIPLATHTPIAPKPVLINFNKHTPADLVCIFTLKFDGTLKRLNVFETLELDDLNSDKHCLPDICNVIKYKE
ncbi:uncharacterized protein PHACADRAFT_200218 [Phanerochaete carnosa HHB-10118-sp]|uniref:Uncharacterized protein n=1 Tax=Phanerochaete carnosa (strain HHB-10118-sp) TaxID=650164 RepID=K5UNS2_PHACS|nr:uncharacterized protein PHACADRAFT_200218 [Phanerochaete carnosa HHB-10118-sp]EKM51396.1 hypothetical protein PHACADRAFT_200218 [Phanerochaete carnosa HHB-10118-sp]